MRAAWRSCPAAMLEAALGACAASDQQTATIGPDGSGSFATDGVRAQALVPGRPGRVFVFAGVDTACKPLPAPELTVKRAPAKGDVTFRPGQATAIAASAGGTCKGAAAIGTAVYYTARTGTLGRDSFSVSARLASGETLARDFEVIIAE